MSSEDIAISVRNLTKTYRLFGHPGDRVKQFMSLGLRKYHRPFTALKGVSLDIRKGETVGIIGRNGAGKSTLLQLICGVLKPTSGQIRINGRVSALLELGAGFNPEFTGRENVFFQGAILGIGREEIKARLHEIIELADIGDFIDQPVRTYSSGMFVRLAFAVAIHTRPDILVVDEALAVGDLAFQERCFRKIRELKDAGGTILFVSHALEQVAHHCNRAALLERGELVAFGPVAEVLNRYLHKAHSVTAHFATETLPVADRVMLHPAYNPEERRWGDGTARISDVKIMQGIKENPGHIIPGKAVIIRLEVRFLSDVNQPIIGFAIKSPDGALLLEANSREASSELSVQKAGDSITFEISFDPILEHGDYLLSFGIVSESSEGLIVHDRRYDAVTITIERPELDSAYQLLNPRFIIATNA
ncbi:MAG: ABC transporter ATP-binding protein [Betaproteobacteria bacterium]|nr:ABC transporter ATP-binding protein [Betaproteobacteria bacterium]